MRERERERERKRESSEVMVLVRIASFASLGPYGVLHQAFW